MDGSDQDDTAETAAREPDRRTGREASVAETDSTSEGADKSEAMQEADTANGESPEPSD